MKWNATGSGRKSLEIDVKEFEKEKFSMFFSVRPHDRYRVDTSLYGLDLWSRGRGKVLNLIWYTIGGDPEILSFRRGDWEDIFLGPKLIE